MPGLLKNMSGWLRSAFWDKVFVSQPKRVYAKKKKEPKTSLRAEERQTIEGNKRKMR